MIAIIDYNSGNTASVANALRRLGQRYEITGDPELVARADKIIFPGVGAAKAAMKELKKRGLDKLLRRTKTPVLGICLGLQLLAEFSEEDNTKCLGIIPGRVKRFSDDLKVPQIGWNRVGKDYFYFVHSYYLPVGHYTLATATYGVPFSAIIQKDNFYATQFHPEKSGEAGLQILRNFCTSC